ncbi:MAG TPA: hypothetical protein VHC21_01800 [Candidatus Saccharimonadales bacterium]|nr:hypothetical protein [Candidatus Saccharimonadales bacterium]
MHILTKSKNLVRGAAITGSVIGVLAVPAAAFAHGGYNDGRVATAASQTQSQSQSQQSQSQTNQTYQGHSWAWWWQQRHQTCDQRQQQLNQAAANAKSKDTKQLNGLNIVYTGTQDYITTGSITVANYDSLKATADADQTKATNAVNGITAPQLNCDSDANSQNQLDKDNSGATTTTNNSIKAASDALNTYKHDVLNLFNAAINS